MVHTICVYAYGVTIRVWYGLLYHTRTYIYMVYIPVYIGIAGQWRIGDDYCETSNAHAVYRVEMVEVSDDYKSRR